MKRLLLLLPLVFMLAGCGVEKVDAGNRGVKKHMGKVEEKALDPGMYFINPFTTNIVEMDVQSNTFQATTTAYTKDIQKATITYSVTIALKPEAVVQMYSNVGERWTDKLLGQAVNGSLKDIVGGWNAVDLIANRNKATDAVHDLIAQTLEPRGIAVGEFQLTDISYDPQFEKAVEDKVTAIQRAEQAKNQTVQIQEQANQKIITAKADAQAMQIKTDALKQSNDLILYELAIRWDGKLSTFIGGDVLSAAMAKFTAPKAQ